MNFFFILSDFFGNGFSNSVIVRSRLSCLFSQLKFFEFYVRTCPAMFFVSSFGALFRFTFVHTAKLKNLNRLNDFFLSLTAFARVTSFLTLSLSLGRPRAIFPKFSRLCFIYAILSELSAWRYFSQGVFYSQGVWMILFGHTWLASLSEMTSSLSNWRSLLKFKVIRNS